MGEKIQQWRNNASGTLDRKGLGHSAANIGVPFLDDYLGGCPGFLALDEQASRGLTMPNPETLMHGVIMNAVISALALGM